jgi:hypothetical protein
VLKPSVGRREIEEELDTVGRDGTVAFRVQSGRNRGGATTGYSRHVFHKCEDAKVHFVQEAGVLTRHLSIVIGIERVLAVS